MTDEEFETLRKLGERHGRTATVNGTTYRFGLNGLRMSVAPSALDNPALGFWREESTGPSKVRRTWIEPGTAEYRKVDHAMRARPTATMELSPGPKKRHTPSPKIVITDAALEDMSQQMFWTTREDALEIGGFLFGTVKGSTVTLTRATGPGRSAEREPCRLKIDIGQTSGWELGEDAPTLIGIWHSHPDGDMEPSPEDKRAWLGGLARVRQHACEYVGLIFADPQETNWMNPHVRGWIASVDENGDPRLTEAKLKASL